MKAAHPIKSCWGMKLLTARAGMPDGMDCIHLNRVSAQLVKSLSALELGRRDSSASAFPAPGISSHHELLGGIGDRSWL